MQAANLWVVGQVIGYVERYASRDEAGAELDWYLLRSMPNCEFRARDELQRRGFSPYVPTQIRWVRYNRKLPAKQTKPLLPGYILLANPGPPNWMSLKRISTLAGAACIGLSPITLPRREVIDLMACEAVGGFDYTMELLADGSEAKVIRDRNGNRFDVDSRVRIVSGVFASFKANVVAVPSQYDEPIELEVSMFGRATRVKADIDTLVIEA